MLGQVGTQLLCTTVLAGTNPGSGDFLTGGALILCVPNSRPFFDLPGSPQINKRVITRMDCYPQTLDPADTKPKPQPLQQSLGPLRNPDGFAETAGRS